MTALQTSGGQTSGGGGQIQAKATAVAVRGGLQTIRVAGFKTPLVQAEVTRREVTIAGHRQAHLQAGHRQAHLQPMRRSSSHEPPRLRCRRQAAIAAVARRS